MKKTITTPDNFTWHIVDASEAKSLHQSNHEVYQIYDDLSESLIDEGHSFDNNNTYGIEPSTKNQTMLTKIESAMILATLDVLQLNNDLSKADAAWDLITEYFDSLDSVQNREEDGE